MSEERGQEYQSPKKEDADAYTKPESDAAGPEWNGIDSGSAVVRFECEHGAWTGHQT